MASFMYEIAARPHYLIVASYLEQGGASRAPHPTRGVMLEVERFFAFAQNDRQRGIVGASIARP